MSQVAQVTREKGREYERAKRERLYQADYRCLYCPDCGDGPFVMLGVHVTKRHGRERRRQMEREGVVMVMPKTSRLMTVELAERGIVGRPRQTLCNRGHPLVGRNVVRKSNGTRTCRRCMNALARGYLELEERVCACRKCDRRFMPRRSNQFYCSQRCRLREKQYLYLETPGGRERHRLAAARARARRGP